jgi:hypothetical protein
MLLLALDGTDISIIVLYCPISEVLIPYATNSTVDGFT